MHHCWIKYCFSSKIISYWPWTFDSVSILVIIYIKNKISKTFTLHWRQKLHLAYITHTQKRLTPRDQDLNYNYSIKLWKRAELVHFMFQCCFSIGLLFTVTVIWGHVFIYFASNNPWNSATREGSQIAGASPACQSCCPCQDHVQYICHVVNNKHCARNAHTHSHLHTKRPVKLIRLIINYTKKMGKLLII